MLMHNPPQVNTSSFLYSSDYFLFAPCFAVILYPHCLPGNTALTYACAGGFVDVVKVLLKEGANIEDHNENGHTPLMEAASAGHVEVARVLLEYGAGINTHSNEFKESALTLACYKGQSSNIVSVLLIIISWFCTINRLYLYANGDQIIGKWICFWPSAGHLDMVRFLLEAGADQEHKTDEMHTALMEACMVSI